ncbi:hypothetical protein BUE76_08810 [Cnuella takakiae]|nr:hypothetical protein BUE76_08810 [Cnuella takakiae]
MFKVYPRKVVQDRPQKVGGLQSWFIADLFFYQHFPKEAAPASGVQKYRQQTNLEGLVYM